MKGKNARVLEDFLSSPFTPKYVLKRSHPTVSPSPEASSTCCQLDSAVPSSSPPCIDPPKKPKLDAFAEQVVQLASSSLLTDISSLQNKNYELEKENRQLKEQIRKLVRKVEDLRKKKDTRSLNQKVKRHKKSVLFWKEKHEELKEGAENVVKLKKQNQEAKLGLRKLKSATSRKANRYKDRLAKVTASTSVRQQELSRLTVGLLESKCKLQHQQEDIAYYDDMLAQHQQVPHVFTTKSDGKTYDSKIREASYLLQESGVAQSRVGSTLKKLAKTLTDQDLEHVPSYSTQNNMTREMRALAKTQAKESLSGSSAVTIKYDGTTKRLGHLVEVEAVTDSGETLLLGLRQQPGGKATEYVETISDMCQSVDLQLGQVTNTMTDRCATNSAIVRQLEDRKGANINDFKCAMHPLDSMAKSCDLKVAEFERETSEPQTPGQQLPFRHRGESHTQATVRLVAKMFHNTKYFAEDLHTYLSEIFGTGTLYYRFVGNRFHIYFLSSGMLFCYIKHIRDYFTNVQQPRNLVETSVRNSLKSKNIEVTLRALGLVGKAVTGPWMRLVGTEPNILQMNQHFNEAVQQLTGKCHRASCFNFYCI